MDMSPKRVLRLLDEAKDYGAELGVNGDHVGRKPPPPKLTVRVVLPPGKTHRFMVASDIHIGNAYHLKDPFQDFIHRGYDAGIRTCLVPGDILSGCYRHSRWEDLPGFDAQAGLAAETFPRLPGLEYWAIGGNHDQTFEDMIGMSVCKALEEVFQRQGRKDLHMLGMRGAYLRLGERGKRGLLTEMWHPIGKTAYALSYKLQKHVEGYAPGQKPDVLLAGHWHQQCYFTTRGVHAMSCGTWQGGQSAFGKALGGAPSIGGWTISWAATKDGTIREFQPTWHAYYEVEKVRDVGLT
jgi:UDP-2,3-diacylglucosamine pyrophosphatase LpxH